MSVSVDLAGKAAIVTGASRGIGREIALALAEAGAAVLCAATNEALLAETVKAITDKGGKAQAVKADVALAADAEKLAAAALAAWGRIDILVNNAGITRDNLLLRMKEEEWDQVLAVNLKGCFNCTKAVVRPMMKQRAGKIINLSSVIGLTGNPGQANYAASKAGIIALTQSAAKEFGSRNLQINAIAPGFITTDMTAALGDDVKTKMLANIPLGRLGTPRDVANAVLFLASGMSDYVTGQVIVVDGGMVM
ncbi:MAG: 3-oxoacyl-[acyl-carrier-protein] reductase [Planctomycetes bacterium]|nr:3-oxoacyl-[acyl-carrier-protein] reductase [Planctomycetota bacterium]